MAAVLPFSAPGVTIPNRGIRTASSGAATNYGNTQNLSIESYLFDGISTLDTWSSGIRDLVATIWEPTAEADCAIATFAVATGVVTFTHTTNTDLDGILHVVRKSR